MGKTEQNRESTMNRVQTVRTVLGGAVACAGLVLAVVAVTRAGDDRPMTGHSMHDMHSTRMFAGAKVNGGTVMHSKKNGRHVLTWSDDFKIPDTPAPHWQVVDSKGSTYLLQRLKIKDDKLNRSIVLPSYIQDVAKVQIWCAWAEALLGEAPFDTPMK
jgi:hypothetical protein